MSSLKSGEEFRRCFAGVNFLKVYFTGLLRLRGGAKDGHPSKSLAEPDECIYISLYVQKCTLYPHRLFFLVVALWLVIF